MADATQDSIPRLLLELGFLRLREGGFADARTFFDGARALRPADPTPALFLGMTSFAENRLADAEREYRAILRDHDGHPMTRAHLAEVLIAARRWNEAEPILVEVSKDARDADAAAFAGELLSALQKGIFQRAR